MNSIKDTIKYTKKLTLLYVEDNEEARESTNIIFQEFFDHTVIAVNGEDGLEKFKTQETDLIITDINMPKLNGLEMIKKIREIDKNIPILVLSAYSDSGYFMDSIKLAVNGYLLKPIDMNQFLGVMERVTDKLRLQYEADKNLHFLHQYQEATDKSSIVSKTDLKGKITYANDEFCRISEYSREELIGQNHNIVRHPENSIQEYQEMWDTIQNKKQIWKGIIRNITKSGKSYYVNSTVKPILDPDGNITEYIALRDDITDIMNPKKQLHDFVNSTKDVLCVLVKIENFDDIEKIYGQVMSHEVEEKLSRILFEKIPDNCNFERIYPLGNGDYAFIQSREKCIKDIPTITAILKGFQEDITDTVIDIGEIDYNVSVLISISYGKDVLENVKIGMKELLKTKQDFIVANGLAQKEHEEAEQNLRTLKKVKIALENSKIISHFQPIINNKTKQIEKYESLVRLIDEDGKILAPFFFLDTAKKGKYYSQITTMVLNNSFEALNRTDKDITMNLSALDIELKSTRDKIFNLLEQNSHNTSRIVFELLEDEHVKDFNTIKIFIDDVKKLGVRIAIDDFGAGYSNFERLLDYQPDILKIDGYLVRDIETNSYSLSVVETIVAFAKKQNIKTVAEFVENEAIYNILKELGVDYSQGYYFAKPAELE